MGKFIKISGNVNPNSLGAADRESYINNDLCASIDFGKALLPHGHNIKIEDRKPGWYISVQFAAMSKEGTLGEVFYFMEEKLARDNLTNLAEIDPY